MKTIFLEGDYVLADHTADEYCYIAQVKGIALLYSTIGFVKITEKEAQDFIAEQLGKGNSNESDQIGLYYFVRYFSGDKEWLPFSEVYEFDLESGDTVFYKPKTQHFFSQTKNFEIKNVDLHKQQITGLFKNKEEIATLAQIRVIRRTKKESVAKVETFYVENRSSLLNEYEQLLESYETNPTLAGCEELLAICEDLNDKEKIKIVLDLFFDTDNGKIPSIEKTGDIEVIGRYVKLLEKQTDTLKDLKEDKEGAVGSKNKESIDYLEEQIRDIERKTNEKINLQANLQLEQVIFEHTNYFVAIDWKLKPRINLLLGNNAYGKSYLLKLLTAIMRKKDPLRNILKHFQETKIKKYDDWKIDITYNRKKENKEEKLTTSFSYDVSMGSKAFYKGDEGLIPVLAIPAVRFLNQNTDSIAKPARKDNKAIKLSQYATDDFLRGVPSTETLYHVIDYIEELSKAEGSNKAKELFVMLADVLGKLTKDEYPYKAYELYYDKGQITDRDITIKLKTIYKENEDSETHLFDDNTRLQFVSNGVLSIFAIFTIIYFYLRDIWTSPEYGKVVAENEINQQSGIVIIDEIDAHLHPSWKRKIIELLVEKFPNVQFILTAHSPLIAAGCYAGEVSIIRFDEIQRGFILEQQEHDFIGDLPEEVLLEWFNLPSVYDEKYEEWYKLYAAYKENPKSVEGKKVQELIEDLKKLNAKIDSGAKLSTKETHDYRKMYRQYISFRELEDGISDAPLVDKLSRKIAELKNEIEQLKADNKKLAEQQTLVPKTNTPKRKTTNKKTDENS